MTARVGSTVHPWYKGIREWQVKGIAELAKPIEYRDTEQLNVSYDPKIMLLESEKVGKVLWFNYWISTADTEGKMKWGGGPPILEEGVFLELMKNAIRKALFTKGFLKKLDRELRTAL